MAGRLAPTPAWLDQYGVNSSFLFQRGHGYMSLRLSDCVEPIFDIGHIFGPQPLYRCLAACQSTRGCGVLSFFQIPAKDRLSRHPRGFCLLKSERCLMSTNNLTFGSCAMRQPSSRRRFDGWCNIVVEPRQRTCAVERRLALAQAVPLSNPQAPSLGRSTGEGQHVAQHGDSHEAVFMWTDAVLGGGLNNMLLHITQLLSESCGARKVLLMPRLMADPIEYGFATFTMEAQHMASHVKEGKVSPPRSLAFSEVFDFGTFAREMQPCAVTEELPVGAVRVHINVSKLHDTKREGGGQPWYSAREY